MPISSFVCQIYLQVWGKVTLTINGPQKTLIILWLLMIPVDPLCKTIFFRIYRYFNIIYQIIFFILNDIQKRTLWEGTARLVQFFFNLLAHNGNLPKNLNFPGWVIIGHQGP